MTILETDRVILRRLVPSDLAALAALYGDPRVRRYFPEGILSVAETVEELEWFLNGHPDFPQLGLWATIDKTTQAFIGRCGLLPWTIAGRQEVEIAYLLDPACWGRGLGTEIARALVQYGLRQLNLPRLIALIDSGNQPSIRVAEAAGLAFERNGEVEGTACAIYAIEARSALRR
ncbi:MAG: GNAT family N-acetyltransferase [Rhodospirillaceae bacterium]|nr:GNAT family N-acetyltransferase [Rhodospirillaceae bacterium]